MKNKQSILLVKWSLEERSFNILPAPHGDHCRILVVCPYNRFRSGPETLQVFAYTRRELLHLRCRRHLDREFRRSSTPGASHLRMLPAK